MNESKEKQSIRDAYFHFKKNPDLNSEKLISVLSNYNSAWETERKQSHDAIWRQNISFYSGNHYSRDINSSNAPYRAKLKENHTNNVINRLVSVFVQNLPIVRVFPGSSSDQ